MPVRGKLVLKGGLQVTAAGVEKKSKKRKKQRAPAEETDGKQPGAKPQGISAMGNKTYEEEFALEMETARQGKPKTTPWGSGFRAAPEILHGYDKKVKGKNAEERLDMRAAIKADKHCK